MLPIINWTFIKEEQMVEENSKNTEKQVNHQGHTYGIGDHQLPNPAELVKKIIESEILEHQAWANDLGDYYYPELDVTMKDSYWQVREKKYFEIETLLRSNKLEAASWNIAGSLHYAMSLEDMKDAITTKFKEMVVSGNLINEKSFHDSHDRTAFYPAMSRGNTNLRESGVLNI